jgi:hypothetical protein
MKKFSTLIFLVNRIRSEIKDASFYKHSDSDEYQKEQEDQYAPPDIAVKSVLNYARSLQVTDTKAVGKLEWVLN